MICTGICVCNRDNYVETLVTSIYEVKACSAPKMMHLIVALRKILFHFTKVLKLSISYALQ